VVGFGWLVVVVAGVISFTGTCAETSFTGVSTSLRVTVGILFWSIRLANCF
jgi:hypothetical protein